MPSSKSAEKRMRQNAKRRLQNRAIKSTIKTEVKKTFELAEEGAVDELKEQLKLAVMRLDKAAAKRIIHPNQAARKKSQLARLFNKTAAAGK